VERTSKSMRLKHSVTSGFFLIRSSRASSSGSDSTLSLITVDISTSPRCLSGVKFSLIMPGGWIGSYASVASLPAYFFNQKHLGGNHYKYDSLATGMFGQELSDVVCFAVNDNLDD